jgi:hypothetical protein
MAHRIQLVIDCHLSARQVEFWALALGYQPEPPPLGFDTWNDYWRHLKVPEEELETDRDSCDSIVDPEGAGPRIWFQIVPETKSIKNRVHLDIAVSGGIREVPRTLRKERVDTKAAELIAIGASLVMVHDVEGSDHYAITMHDPEGNEFCIN